MNIIITSRERLLLMINNKKPDRMACQVHSWMEYYLKTYLNDMDQYEAYEYFKMDAVIYQNPQYNYNNSDLSNWDVKYKVGNTDNNGNTPWENVITTPKGILRESGEYNQYTKWTNEHLIKNEADFEIWNEYVPVPIATDWSNILHAKEKIGDKGIVRGCIYDFGQGSPWQSFAGCLFPMEDAILMCYDNPQWVHYVLKSMLDKKIRSIEVGGDIPLDLVELGGGAGSSTVISPTLHKEFCLPYDKIQVEAIQNAGSKTVYHLCGGIMPLLEIIAENGTNGLETMTPPEMGGDCILEEATNRVGAKMFFVGGFNQNKGFENDGCVEIKDMVFKLHSACPNGGFICSPSDHFFFGNPENIRMFVEAAKECKY